MNCGLTVNENVGKHEKIDGDPTLEYDDAVCFAAL